MTHYLFGFFNLIRSKLPFIEIYVQNYYFINIHNNNLDNFYHE